MKLWIVVPKGFGYIWLMIAVLAILAGTAGTWMTKGFPAVQDLMSAYNVVNWIVTAITLAPGLGAIAWAEKLKTKKPLVDMRALACTSLVLMALLFGCDRSEPPPTIGGKPFEVRCKEPLPVFTLGEKSKPTQEQVTALCACIWGNLGNWERSTSEKIVAGKKTEVSEMYMRAFPSRFGSALEKCGGMKL